MQGLPFKHLTQKRRLTTSPSLTGFSTPVVTGQFRCHLVATCLADPHYAHIFSNIAASGGPIPDLRALHCSHLPAAKARISWWPAEALARASFPASLGSIGRSSTRQGCVYIQTIWTLEHLFFQFRTSYIYHHWPTSTINSFWSFHASRQKTHLLRTSPSVRAYLDDTCALASLPLAPALHHLHPASLQAGQLRDAASLALGVPGTRTALQSAV